MLSLSDLASAGPPEPLDRGPGRSHPPAVAAAGDVVGDLLGGDLQPEEGVHAGEVAAVGGRPGHVQPAHAAARAAQFEAALHVQPAERVPACAAVLEQVPEHPVLGHVAVQAGAVDDVVGPHLLLAVGPLEPAHHHVAVERQVRERAGLGPVPAAAPGLVQTALPVPAPRRGGAFDLVVGLDQVAPLPAAHACLELPAPCGLRVVEALVGVAVPAGNVVAQHVHDLRLRAVLLAVADQPVQHRGGHDAAAPDDHRARPAAQRLVHVLVVLIAVDHVVVVVHLLPEALQLRQEPQPRVADRDVHVPAPVRDRAGQATLAALAEPRDQHGEVAAAGTPAHGAHLALHQHVPVPDPARLALHAVEDVA